MLVVAIGCSAPRVDASLVRLVGGTADTVIVHSRRPHQIPVRALDDAGHDVRVSGVRFEWISGDPLNISESGSVTCPQRADAAVRASVQERATTIVLRCRSVRSVRIAGPVQLIAGDSAQAIPVEVLGADGQSVDLLTGTLTLGDSRLAAIDGMRLRPLAVGGTSVSLRIGDEEGYASVHIFERVATLNGLRPEQQYVALPLGLSGGDTRQWHLPPGQWMLTMMPYEDESRGLRLRVEGAVCMPATLTRRRIVCEAKTVASVIVYHPQKVSGSQLTGTLLVRRVNS